MDNKEIVYDNKYNEFKSLIEGRLDSCFVSEPEFPKYLRTIIKKQKFIDGKWITFQEEKILENPNYRPIDKETEARKNIKIMENLLNAFRLLVRHCKIDIDLFNEESHRELKFLPYKKYFESWYREYFNLIIEKETDNQGKRNFNYSAITDEYPQNLRLEQIVNINLIDPLYLVLSAFIQPSSIKNTSYCTLSGSIYRTKHNNGLMELEKCDFLNRKIRKVFLEVFTEYLIKFDQKHATEFLNRFNTYAQDIEDLKFKDDKKCIGQIDEYAEHEFSVEISNRLKDKMNISQLLFFSDNFSFINAERFIKNYNLFLKKKYNNSDVEIQIALRNLLNKINNSTLNNYANEQFYGDFLKFFSDINQLIASAQSLIYDGSLDSFLQICALEIKPYEQDPTKTDCFKNFFDMQNIINLAIYDGALGTLNTQIKSFYQLIILKYFILETCIPYYSKIFNENDTLQIKIAHAVKKLFEQNFSLDELQIIFRFVLRKCSENRLSITRGENFLILQKLNLFTKDQVIQIINFKNKKNPYEIILRDNKRKKFVKWIILNKGQKLNYFDLKLIGDDYLVKNLKFWLLTIFLTLLNVVYILYIISEILLKIKERIYDIYIISSNTLSSIYNTFKIFDQNYDLTFFGDVLFCAFFVLVLHYLGSGPKDNILAICIGLVIISLIIIITAYHLLTHAPLDLLYNAIMIFSATLLFECIKIIHNRDSEIGFYTDKIDEISNLNYENCL